MNCKPGDLAIYVGPVFESKGMIVRCISQVMFRGGPGWLVDPALAEVPGYARHPLDVNLRPIRDSDGEDETLTWAGKPQQVTA